MKENMELGELIFISVYMIIVVIGLIWFVWSLVKIYFLRFKLENHPILINLIEEKLKSICEKEGIHVYMKTYDELNQNVENEDNKAVGKYCYTLDEEYQKLANKIIASCNKLKTYENYKSSMYYEIIERATLPRILLCKEYVINRFGLGSYYSIYLHELGHHFAAKELKNNHSEIDADRYAHKIALKELPLFLQLTYHFNFKYQLGNTELSFFKKIQALLQFVIYLVKRKLGVKQFGITA